MKYLRKVSVVTERGKLVGVQIPPEPSSDPRAPLAALVAGPKQKLFELQVEVPAVLKSSKDIDAFHAAVRKKLKTGRRKK
jgi:hypothetical protein